MSIAEFQRDAVATEVEEPDLFGKLFGNSLADSSRFVAQKEASWRDVCLSTASTLLKNGHRQLFVPFSSEPLHRRQKNVSDSRSIGATGASGRLQTSNAAAPAIFAPSKARSRTSEF